MNHSKMSKGITLSKEEILKLKELLNDERVGNLYNILKLKDCNRKNRCCCFRRVSCFGIKNLHNRTFFGG